MTDNERGEERNPPHLLQPTTIAGKFVGAMRTQAINGLFFPLVPYLLRQQLHTTTMKDGPFL